MKKNSINEFNKILNEIKPVNLISHNRSNFFKNISYNNLYKKNYSFTKNKKDIKKIDNKNILLESDYDSIKMINNDIKNIFNLNLNFFENTKYNKIKIDNESNMDENNDNKMKTLKEFLQEKIDIHRKHILNVKMNENSRHSPGQYNPNYNYLYKKISSPIFNKTSSKKSIFDEICSLNNSKNKTKNKHNYSNDIDNYELIEDNNQLDENYNHNKNYNKLKLFKKNNISLKKNIRNNFINSNYNFLSIKKNFKNSRNTKYNKKNSFLNDSTKDTKEIVNKNKSVDDLINYKEKELSLKEKIKIFLNSSKKTEKEYNKFLILNPLYKYSPRKFNINFNKMLGRDSNINKDSYNNLNKYNPNFSTIYPRVQTAFFGETIKNNNNSKFSKRNLMINYNKIIQLKKISDLRKKFFINHNQMNK